MDWGLYDMGITANAGGVRIAGGNRAKTVGLVVRGTSHRVADTPWERIRDNKRAATLRAENQRRHEAAM